MAMIRPTLILEMDLDERDFSEEMATDLRRAYMHISGNQVKSHVAGDGAPENVIRFRMKMRKPCWDASEEGADELWCNVMPKWLRNMFYKVSANMVAFNRMRAESGDPQMIFSWLELDFGGSMLLSIHLNHDSSIPADAGEWVQAARSAWNEGSLGAGVVGVSIPSVASYATQAAPHVIRREIPENLETEFVDVSKDKGTEAAPAESEAAAAECAENADIENGQDGSAMRVEFDVEPFDIDFSVWGVRRADGAVEEINA